MRTLGVKLEFVNLDAELCRRCPGSRPGPFALLSLGNAELETRPLSDRLADPLFMPMQPAEAAALGLSAIHALISQGEGFLAVTRSSGAASAFYVFLPCAALPVIGQTAEAPAAPRDDFSGETILLVEDEPLVRELSRDMLERQGYRVILAGDANEAERIARTRRPVSICLITDTVMPTISGVELARRLRASHPGIKVLFILGYADQQVEREDMALLGAFFPPEAILGRLAGPQDRQVLNRT